MLWLDLVKWVCIRLWWDYRHGNFLVSCWFSLAPVYARSISLILPIPHPLFPCIVDEFCRFDETLGTPSSSRTAENYVQQAGMRYAHTYDTCFVAQTLGRRLPRSKQTNNWNGCSIFVCWSEGSCFNGQDTFTFTKKNIYVFSPNIFDTKTFQYSSCE